jgi:hypothetical protein
LTYLLVDLGALAHAMLAKQRLDVADFLPYRVPGYRNEIRPTTSDIRIVGVSSGSILLTVTVAATLLTGLAALVQVLEYIERRLLRTPGPSPLRLDSNPSEVLDPETRRKLNAIVQDEAIRSSDERAVLYRVFSRLSELGIALTPAQAHAASAIVERWLRVLRGG